MIIGIDLDGVVYNSEFWMQAFAEIFDIENGGNGIVDSSENSISKRYGWDDEFARKFRLKYLPIQMKECPLMPYAKETLQKLKDNGHKIIIVTSRGSVDKSHIEITQNRLKKDKIPFDELYFSKENKVTICKNKGIDIMVDDTPTIIEQLANENIKCLYFKNGNTRDITNNNVKTVLNFGEVFRQIYNLEKQKLIGVNCEKSYI